MRSGNWVYSVLLLLLLCAIAFLYEQFREPSAADEAAPEQSIRLTLAAWSSDDGFMAFLIRHVKSYEDEHPNVTIDVDPFKSDGDFLQAMRIRSASGQLPDLVQLKPNWLSEFADQLEPLAGTFVDRNRLAKRYSLDGQVLAVPAVVFPEMVYYHPDIFASLGLEVPTTWPEWLNTLKKIKADGRYVPYAMGGKDGWPDYPFNEFMPLLAANDEDYLSKLAKEDRPFGEGSAFYEAYERIAAMYDAGVMGSDPLETGWTEAAEQFAQGKAATIAAGLWYLSSYEEATGGTDDLAAFPLPYRMTEEEPLNVLTFADHFMGISKGGAHADEARRFLEWFFSEEAYREYLREARLESTMDGIVAELPFLAKWQASAPDMRAFYYIPGNEAYTRLSNAIGLDVKQLGQDMMAGRSLDSIVAELNDNWSLARTNAGGTGG